ncbi:MAG: hypothetical protein RLN72_06820, partial [Henriciella sp.]
FLGALSSLSVVNVSLSNAYEEFLGSEWYVEPVTVPELHLADESHGPTTVRLLEVSLNDKLVFRMKYLVLTPDLELQRRFRETASNDQMYDLEITCGKHFGDPRDYMLGDLS